ncbi:MAG: hypothetical protein ACP5RX_03055 [Minisyncoccia bacterium]
MNETQNKIDIMPRYSLTIRITKKQKEFLQEMRKEYGIPAAYFIRILIDNKMKEMGENDGEREQGNPK